MSYYTPTEKEATLTDLEKNVLSAFVDGLYAEKHFSDIDAKDIAEWTKLPIKQVRGVISSLVKKDYIHLEDNGDFVIIYLCSDKHYLHSEWSQI